MAWRWCRGLVAVVGLKPGEVFHIGSGADISVADLFKLISDLMGSDAEIELDPARERPPQSEVLRLRCDAKKLEEAAGFFPEVSLRDGLRKTINWFRDPNNLRGYKHYLYNV